MSYHVLIVDDDAHIRDVLRFALEKDGMNVTESDNGSSALASITQDVPDLVIMDISMPEMDGLECCRHIRKQSDLPILFLSSRDEEIDRIIGLEIGGDDYVTKPFSPRELVARVKAILKRSTKLTSSPTPDQTTDDIIYTHGLLTVYADRHQLVFDGTALAPMTATEFAIIESMIQRPQRVYSRESLITLIYGDNIHVSDRTIDSHIRHIRAKFLHIGCNNIIDTVHGVGYRLGKCD